jgi:hypothetical protein
MGFASCAWMERSSVIVAGENSAERHLATLTLRRGATNWGSWSFDPEDAGITISVGGCAGCDWQVAAPGIGPLRVLFTGECLLIKNDGPSDDVWLNGARLRPSWVPLESGDVVELGGACMEVTIPPLAAIGLLSEERSLPASLPHQASAPAAPVQASQACVPTARVRPWSRYFRSGPARAIDAGEPERTKVEEPDERLTTIFDDTLPALSSVGLKRALILSVAVALAYVGWLVLLDHL